MVADVSAHAETLEQAVQSTLQNHPSVDKAKAGSSIAEEQSREERSGYFPQISVSGQAGRIYGDNSTSRGLSVTRGAAYSNYWEGAFTARQMIYDGSETRNRIGSARSKIAAANMNLLDVAERLAFSTAQAYLDLMRSRQGLAMLQAHARKVVDYQERVKKMVDDGGADEVEHQQARDIRVILDNMIAEYEGQVRAAEAYYSELTGNLPAEELVFPEARLDRVPASVEEAIAHAKSNHPALQSVVHQSESASYDAKAEKAALYPDVDGEFSYLESEKDDVIGGEVTDGRAVVRLSWDFETGGAQMARIEQKKLKEKESTLQVHELERQIERGIRLAYADYQTALRQADSQEKRYELNKKLFETYTVQFEGARITLLQLMQSDNQLFTTQLEKMNGAYRAAIARYAILAGMGRLRESLGITDTAVASPLSSPVSVSPLTRPSADEQK